MNLDRVQRMVCLNEVCTLPEVWKFVPNCFRLLFQFIIKMDISGVKVMDLLKCFSATAPIDPA